MVDSFHQFLGKEDYLRFLSQSSFYYIISNCLQLNPQMFFSVAANAIPIINGIPNIYYQIYPHLYDLPHSPKIINANNLTYSENQLESIHQSSQSNLERLYNMSKGELYWLDNFELKKFDNSDLSIEDTLQLNSHFVLVIQE